jgi:hypothetical protein
MEENYSSELLKSLHDCYIGIIVDIGGRKFKSAKV